MLDATAVQVTTPVDRTFVEFGATGLNKWSGSVYEERLRELRGRPGRIKYREMRLNDPIISAVFTALEANLKRADWRVVPASEGEADKAAARFLHECMFEDMSFSWSDEISFMLTMLEQGFSLMEIVYKRRLGEEPPPYTRDPASSRYSDGRIGWRKWAPRPPESLVDGDEWKFDESGGIQGANQEVELKGSVYIPIQKLLLFRTTVAPANNPEGMPIHRSMYLPWWYSSQMMEIEGIGVERDLAGIPIVYLGSDCSLKGTDSDYAMAKELVVNLRADEQAGIVIPRPKMGMTTDGNGMLVELLHTSGNRSHDTSAIIERYDKRKAISVLAQFILLGLDHTGSYALARTQGDLFAITIKAWLTIIADTINRFAVPRLFKLNAFPGLTGIPTVEPTEAGVMDLESLGGFINRMVGQAVITPDANLERHLRQVAGLPPPVQPVRIEPAPATALGQPPTSSTNEEPRPVAQSADNVIKDAKRDRRGVKITQTLEARMRRVLDRFGYEPVTEDSLKELREALIQLATDACARAWKAGTPPKAKISRIKDPARTFMHQFIDDLDEILDSAADQWEDEALGVLMSITPDILKLGEVAWRCYLFAANTPVEM